MMKLSFFISCSVGFFAFLEAFSPTNLPEPLEQIRQLGLVKKRTDLWPTIILNSDDEKLDPAFQQELASVIKYYDVVYIFDIPTLPWLALADFKSSVDLHWWKDDIDTSIETSWMAQALDLYVDNDSLLESIVSSVVKSSQIVELGIDFNGYDPSQDDILFTTSMANSVIRWFKSQPVRKFSFSRWDIQIDNPVVTKSFYESMFNCPTLEELECKYSYLNGIEVASLTFAMGTLIFNDCGFNAIQLNALANGLVNSKVTRFDLWSMLSGYVDALAPLFLATMKSSIVAIDISYCCLKTQEWDVLAPILQECTFKSLSLYDVGLNDDGAKSIAKALEQNHSITHLSVSDNPIGFDGLRSLIESGASANRAGKLKSLGLTRSKITSDEEQALEKLASQHGVAINA
ncbi:hypothetical protein AC1031_005858 [Aphanomyces cochlioides]|nr:hypothetical protein AC1031_005858 [Aphanomyces cochlioides]